MYLSGPIHVSDAEVVGDIYYKKPLSSQSMRKNRKLKVTHRNQASLVRSAQPVAEMNIVDPSARTQFTQVKTPTTRTMVE